MSTRAVYSTRFLQIALTNGNVSYIVPDGFLAVVRAVDLVYDGGPTSANGLVRISGNNVQIATLHNVTGQDQFHLSTRQVVMAGEPISCLSSSGNACHFSVSGYLLSLP